MWKHLLFAATASLLFAACTPDSNRANASASDDQVSGQSPTSTNAFAPDPRVIEKVEVDTFSNRRRVTLLTGYLPTSRKDVVLRALFVPNGGIYRFVPTITLINPSDSLVRNIQERACFDSKIDQTYSSSAFCMHLGGGKSSQSGEIPHLNYGVLGNAENWLDWSEASTAQFRSGSFSFALPDVTRTTLTQLIRRGKQLEAEQRR